MFGSILVATVLSLAVIGVGVLLVVSIFLMCVFCRIYFRSKNVWLISPRPVSDLEPEIDDEKLIKTPFTEYKGLDGGKPYDVIYVGSGVSSLSSASYVVQHRNRNLKGTDSLFKVLVLEQNEQLGGMTHTFTEGGYEFSTGVHFTSSTFGSNVFWSKASENRLRFRPLCHPSETTMDVIHWDDQEDPRRNETFCVPKGRREMQQWMEDRFPSKVQSIAQFFSDARHVGSEDLYLRLLRHCVGGNSWIPTCCRGLIQWVLEKFVGARIFELSSIRAADYLNQICPGDDCESRQVRSILGFYSTLVGRVDECTAADAMICVFHVLKGTPEGSMGKMYPVGGASRIAKELTRTIRRYGGEAYCSAEVSQIELTPDMTAVRGVTMRDGTFIPGRRVVSAAGFKVTYSDLLPRELSPPAIDELSRPGMHFVQAFLGFDLPFQELGLTSADLILAIDDVENVAATVLTDEQDLEKQSMCYIGNPNSVHPPGPGKTGLSLLIPSNSRHFERWEGTTINQRGSEYEDLKLAVVDFWLKILYRHYPLLEDHLEILKIGTVLSSKHWTAWKTGEAYGAVCTPRRVYESLDECVTKIESRVKGLIMSSTDVCLQPGLPGALMVGVVTAGKILNHNLFLDLVNIDVRKKGREAMQKLGDSVDRDYLEKVKREQSRVQLAEDDRDGLENGGAELRG